MKLYYSKRACSLAIRILIHEMGISCEFEAVNLKTKKTDIDADYLKINPKGSVPALVLPNGEILTENVVIQQYLAEKNQAWQLLPPNTDFKHYRVLEWLNFISTDLHKTCGPLFQTDYPQEAKEKFVIPKFKAKLAIVENHLKHNKYLMDDQFTAADTYLFVITLWMPSFHMPLTDWPNLSRYSRDLQMRKSVKQALQEENITLQ